MHIQINIMSAKNEILELRNLCLCKYIDQETNGSRWFLLFAYELEEKVLIGCDIISLSAVRAAKTMKITLGKYKVDDVVEVVPGGIEHMLDETHLDFNEDVMTTVGYFVTQGFPFMDTWGKIKFTRMAWMLTEPRGFPCRLDSGSNRTSDRSPRSTSTGRCRSQRTSWARWANARPMQSWSSGSTAGWKNPHPARWSTIPISRKPASAGPSSMPMRGRALSGSMPITAFPT